MAGDFDSEDTKLAAFCANHLDLHAAKLGNEYFYASLPHCVIDAVYSIGVRYEGVQNVVRRYCNYFDVSQVRPSREELPSRPEQQPLSDLVRNMEVLGIERFTRHIFQNSQRTSSQSGILKSDAVFRFARVLSSHSIDFFQDISSHIDDTDLERELRNIPGQSSGISIDYFFMLAGDGRLIKPDRHVLGFLRRVLSRTCGIEEARSLLSNACVTLRPRFPQLTPRVLDYVIWSHERSR